MSVTEVTEDFRGGNTSPPGKLTGKKRKVTEVTEVTDDLELMGGKLPSSKPKSKQLAFHWVFTWANYPENWKDFFNDRKSLIEKICVGEETCPTTGTRHLQGWLRLYKKNAARTYLNLPKTVHWEVMSRQATERQNTKYCSKQGSHLLHWGIPVPFTINVEKKPWMIELKKILEQEPDFRTIHWIWDAEGNTGKTLFSKMVDLEFEDVAAVNGKGHDIRHCVADFITKTGKHPRIVLMNVPRVNKDYISYEALENVKDMFFYSGKYEGCKVNGPCPHVMVFANDRPETFKLSMDRWKIGKIVGDRIEWE